MEILFDIFVVFIILAILLATPFIRPLFYSLIIIFLSIIIGLQFVKSTSYYKNKDQQCDIWKGNVREYRSDIRRLKTNKLWELQPDKTIEQLNINMKQLQEKINKNNCNWFS